MNKFSKNIKKIFIISGGRADYDLLKPIILKLKKMSKIDVKTGVTGSHLFKKNGTHKNFKKDGITIHHKIKIPFLSDTKKSIINFFSHGVIKFGKIFSNEKFDAIIVLGDRYEIYSAVISASFYKIPIIHLSGGETTLGVIDEPIRHSITKFSNFHFVANNIYKKRVIQLGENPKNVFVVGSTSIENIRREKIISKADIEKKYKIRFKPENFLITYHPVTFTKDYGISDFKNLLNFLSKRKNCGLFFTLPNADVNNFEIIRLIKKFIKKNKNAKLFNSLGKQNYFSFIKCIDAVIGNSSSGLTEVPSFKKPTLNIGIRQKGRVQAKSIINIENVNKKNLEKAFKKIQSKKFKRSLTKVSNPYFKKNSSSNVVKIIKRLKIKEIELKPFFDLGRGR